MVFLVAFTTVRYGLNAEAILTFAPDAPTTIILPVALGYVLGLARLPLSVSLLRVRHLVGSCDPPFWPITPSDDLPPVTTTTCL
jgi:hypothetical protein